MLLHDSSSRCRCYFCGPHYTDIFDHCSCFPSIGLYTVVSLLDDVWNCNSQSKATEVVVDFIDPSSVHDSVKHV
ncbi:hypothetical protein RIF29_16697 [Crotalaria pallida]|uniref:Uncharacterized protein n=1 Tax=Crotalaria pallida TaxID=3830 RepID=A0AAN9FMX4_CROPI